ncbi:MAG: DUF3800 domain-containing protein [Oscillospiraceae bacterium]|jgi:hypothetical protein|nr:DUF3800 domain-containing protein [Oscillospiraceae bacterium]
MKELSVFIDESGDFGEYEHHSPFYIVTLVFHDQSSDISQNIKHLDLKIRDYGFPNYTIHTGPLIRREKEFFDLKLIDRKRIFNAIYNFARTADIKYKSFVVEKKQCINELDLISKLSKQLSSFLKDNLKLFTKYDRINCYYDYGQRELTHILVSVFNTILNEVIFKKATPAEYKLSQAADLLCTVELLIAKSERKMLSKSELTFFTSARNLNKSYLRAICTKRI